MPAILLASLNLNANLEKQYPNVTGPQKEVILEIRRERRIEFACECFRYDDLLRWKSGRLFEEIQQGVYIDQFGLHGYTHNIVNLSETEDLVTFMWCNECFDPARPDTYFEKV